MNGLIQPFARIPRQQQILMTILVTGILIGLWAVLPMRLLPKPWDVLRQLQFLILERGLLFNLGVSMWLNVESLIIATAVSLLVSYSFVLPSMRPLVNIIAGLRFCGLVGFAFVFYLLITDSHWVKVAIIVFSMTPYFVTTMAEYVATTSKEEINHARTMKMGPWRTLWEVVIRGKLHLAFEAMRQNAAIGWMMVAMTEGLIRTEGGVGVMLVDQNKFLLLADVFAIVVIIYVVGRFQDLLIRFIRARLCGYAVLDEGSMR